MPKPDPYESELLAAYDHGSLKSVATKSELAKLRAAARATAIKDRRVNIRLSSGDLHDIQTKALEEGLPYQTLIASVLHKYVTGRLAERGGESKKPRLAQKPASRRAAKAGG
jgi:predicted DNA binding CopG/RHH family protein